MALNVKNAGCGPIPGWINRSAFAWLSANIDFPCEPAIAPPVTIINYGGVRHELDAGDITADDVLEVMPFGNTLMLVDLIGTQLKIALGEALIFY